MLNGLHLAIESSAARASVALGRGAKLLRTEAVEAGRRQSEVLLDPLRRALGEGVGEAIALVVVGTGPGSYNGTRVGIAAGQGVGIVHGCAVVGVCSLEGLATVRAGGRCLALGDARRGTFFTLELCDGQLSGELNLIEHAAFARAVEEATESGAALVTLEDPARLKLDPDLAKRVEWAVPSAELLLQAWAAKSEAERATLAAIPPEPYYLRPPHITISGEKGPEGARP